MTIRAAWVASSPAIIAALFFGASVPLSKLLVGDMPPLLLAGLLYLGSGCGLAIALGVRRASARTTMARDEPVERFAIPRADLPWLIGAIAAGGIAGPALLMSGLAHASAASASLLLNMEGVLTALIAWCVFHENADRQIVLGMAAIVAGGALLAWQPGGFSLSAGAFLVLAACLCWAVDNNLTRKISTNDAMLIACLKGLVAGVTNTGLALVSGAVMPAAATVAAALAIGFIGYGVSLVLFVLALRTLGTARAGAYFSIAPLLGVALAFVIWPEVPTPTFWIAAALMCLGLWLHLRERHVHGHTHAPQEHTHEHVHDEHHRHSHDFEWDGAEPHVHPHRTPEVTHQHAHFPDIHHRHPHPHSH